MNHNNVVIEMSSRLESNKPSADTVMSSPEEVVNLLHAIQDDFAREIETVSLKRPWGFYEIIDVLQDYATEHNLTCSQEFQELKEELRNAGHRISSLSNGIKGERITRNCVARLKIPFRMIANATLNSENEVAEYDAIVITQTGIFIIETKYSKHDIYIDKHGYLKGNGWYYCDPYNIGEKMRRKESILWNALSNSSASTVDRNAINSIVNFAYAASEIRDDFKRIPITSNGDICYCIEQGMGSNLTEEQIESIEDAISKSTVSGQYKFEIDIDSLYEKFIDFMSLVYECHTAKDPEPAAIISTPESFQSRIADCLPDFLPFAVTAVISPAAAWAAYLTWRALKA